MCWFPDWSYDFVNGDSNKCVYCGIDIDYFYLVHPMDDTWDFEDRENDSGGYEPK